MRLRLQTALATAFALFLTSTLHAQSPAEPKGSVCTGIYAAVIIQENELSRVHFTVGDSQKFYFDHPGTVVLDNLDLHKTYVVRVFYDDKQIQTWNLRFDRLRVPMVTIWRSGGHWHMDPTLSGKCIKP